MKFSSEKDLVNLRGEARWDPGGPVSGMQSGREISRGQTAQAMGFFSKCNGEPLKVLKHGLHDLIFILQSWF